MNGYLHPGYAQSLSEFGRPRALPRCGGWVLERDIPGSDGRDAMGCYPLFACQDWSLLVEDLGQSNGWVSLALVADPFGAFEQSALRACFPDVFVPFKTHFVVDLRRPLNEFVCKHHRYYARRALQSVQVEICAEPAQLLDDWCDLYANLVERRRLCGIKAFSRAAFARQLRVPGLVALRAVSRGGTVGAHLWYVQGEVAYSHLAACSPLGYDLMAAYALYRQAIVYFAGKQRWLSLGAGAGVKPGGADGLAWFKRGWASDTRTGYFCGRIFDRQRYEHMVRQSGLEALDYFPAYRQGEFG